MLVPIHSFNLHSGTPWHNHAPPPQPSKFKDIMTSFIAPILPLPSIVPDLLNHLHHSRSVFFPSLKSPLRSSHHLCGNPAKKCLTWVQSWGNNQTKSPVFGTSYVTTDPDPSSVSVPWKTNKKNQGLFLIKGENRYVATKGNAWTLIGYRMGKKKASVKNVSVAGSMSTQSVRGMILLIQWSVSLSGMWHWAHGREWSCS